MKTIICDYETYFDQEYSLTRLDPPTYILHDLFEAIVLGVAEDDGKPYIVDGPDIPRFWKDLDPDCAVCSHNLLFDACITSWRYGWVPKLMIDTLAMSRTLLQRYLKSHSLKSVAEYFGLPAKGTMLQNVKGMARADLIANGIWQDYLDYCLHDTWLCREILKRLAPLLPDEEFVIHDMIARCAVEPIFRLEPEILAYHLQNVRADKAELLNKVTSFGVSDKKQLMSNPQFAHILRSLGVDPPLKLSPVTHELSYAFARNDVEFMELRDHEDPRVQAVVEARLGYKSTLEETRTERMLGIARLDFPHHGGQFTMPIPLKVGAAITHRLGGDWQLNCQNWGRQSPIRKSVQAPEGCLVLASDAAQIEARLTAWFCGQWDLVEQFAEGIDVYADFASFIYGYKVNKKDHPGPRFIGKTGILQLGYQSGWLKLMNMVLLKSEQETGVPIELSEAESMRIVYGYRQRFNMISGAWARLGGLISWMANAGPDDEYHWGPVTFRHNRITGPNGLELYYENLRYLMETNEWVYDYGGRTYKLFGGKTLENIIQFLARIATMQAALRIKHRLRQAGMLTVRFAHQAHDELIYVSRIEHAARAALILTEEMSRTPDWAPKLPLKGETKVGRSYGDMKVVS